jgi:hypothetical protein
MEISYYRIKFSSYYAVNDFECPVAYLFKKYAFGHYLPIPRSKRYLNDEYVAVIPTKISSDFIDILVNEEECKVTLLKKEEYEYNNFENTYVYEINERVGGVNTTSLALFKRLQ